METQETQETWGDTRRHRETQGDRRREQGSLEWLDIGKSLFNCSK